jgi:beta-fructofuranosidase
MNLTRRQALALAGAAAAKGGPPQDDPDRPRIHFLPPANWMNDPNAPAFHNGTYHLYYQHNPKAAKWDTMHWGYARSRDLLRWEHRQIALAPTPGGPDKDGCFTGCMVMDNGTPTIVYTGVRPEVQCLATSQDFQTWTKRAEPIIAAPPPGFDTPGFRDPHVWKEGGEWQMLLGAGVRGHGGTLLHYTSANLQDWTYRKQVLTGKMKAEVKGGDVARGEMWECPDFFPVGDRWLLYVSTENTVKHWLGRWKGGEFTPLSEGVLLHGAHYAPKSCAAPGGRRIIWSWIREQRTQEAQLNAGWSGVMSLAIVPTLAPDGSLRLNPAEEYKTLRGGKLPLRKLPEDLCEISVTFPSRYPLILRRGDVVLVECRKGVLRVGRSEAELTAPRITLQIFVDASVVEVFANQSTVVAGRAYSTSGKLVVEGAPESFAAWQLAPVSNNRLTT